MASTNMKRLTAETVASYLASNVAGLSGKVSALQEGPENVQDYPSAALMPVQFTYVPQSEYDEVYELSGSDDGKVVLDVGEFQGLMRLELYARTKPEREQYEQALMDLFLASPGSPGTLFITTPNLTINGYVSLYSVELKVRLNTEEWREEYSFESKRFSFIELEVAYPALTARNAITAQTLELALSDAVDSNTPIDIVTIQVDGSTTPGGP